MLIIKKPQLRDRVDVQSMHIPHTLQDVEIGLPSWLWNERSAVGLFLMIVFGKAVIFGQVLVAVVDEYGRSERVMVAEHALHPSSE